MRGGWLVFPRREINIVGTSFATSERCTRLSERGIKQENGRGGNEDGGGENEAKGWSG